MTRSDAKKKSLLQTAGSNTWWPLGCVVDSAANETLCDAGVLRDEIQRGGPHTACAIHGVQISTP